ncbi:MAG: amidohydrolase family protein [Bdellovibrionia bacterium]
MHTDFTGKPEETSKIMVTKEQLEKEFKEAGIVGAVAHTTVDGEGYDPALKRLGIIHCGGVRKKVDEARLEKGLKDGRYKCVKIYLGYEYQYAYDKGYESVYRLAKKYGVPVVFHTGDTYDPKGKLKFAEPMAIDEVAVDHPDVTFVIAHCGNPWIQTAAEIAYKNPNVYLECSALLIGDMTEQGEEALQENMIKPIHWIFNYIEDPKKLMFGTDWPLVSVKQYLEVYKLAIPEEHWPAVFYENAKRVFKIP